MSIPYPPIELRRSVGPTEERFFDNPAGAPVFADEVAPHQYVRVLDFGCGCGRTARQLMLQSANRPAGYVGVDLYRPSIEWCSANLEPLDGNFRFFHLDAFNAGLNPHGSREHRSLELTAKFTLVNAHSVFTHIIETDVAHYFAECARLLDAGGVFRATWFLFDKSAFPMMQEFQNCLYINPVDPTNAAIYDFGWIRRLYRASNLVIYRIIAPALRGYHWTILATHATADVRAVDFPADDAPVGISRPPTSVAA